MDNALKTPPNSGRAGDRLRQAARAGFVGRARELGWLEDALIAQQALAVFVHGIGGIGKTSLLEAAEARLSERGCRVLRFEGHDVEPTPAGLLSALAAAVGCERRELEAVVAALDALPETTVVLAFDEYDGLRLIDTWLRRSFVPALPGRVRLLLSGRSRPLAAWTSTPGWDALVRVLELGPLERDEATLLLELAGLPAAQQPRVWAIADGHPLALKLAAAAARAHPELPLGELESRHVVSELVQRFLSDVRDPDMRAAIEAACVLRRVTRPLLACALGAEQAEPALVGLAQLPFVETAADGLVVHQSVRHAVASALRALDPARHRALRARAWQALSEDVRSVAHKRSWQATADMIYLLDEPAVREAFFPSDTIRYGAEPAVPRDRDAIMAIAAERADASELRVLEAWWRSLPEAFQVVRDEQHGLLAFYVCTLAAALPAELLAHDAVLARWKAHSEESLPRDGRPVLMCRAMLLARAGNAQSEARATCFLDLKRWYMQHLDLAAVYTANHGEIDYAFCDRMGFKVLSELELQTSPERRVASLCLSFGPGVLPWIGRLIDARIDARAAVGASQRAFALDRAACLLVVEGERKPLTRLEYGLLDYLEQHAGKVASRDELLASVWGQAHTGSNVVDAVVRALRKKLGPHASAIETVTGFGYKLRV